MKHMDTEKNKSSLFAVIGVVLAIAAIFVIIGAIQRQQAEKIHTKNLFAMDTYFSLKAYGQNAEIGLSLCEGRTRELEALLSVTAEGSDVWRINHGQTTSVPAASVSAAAVSGDTYHLILEALEISSQTGGALDITLYPVLKEWGFTTGTYQIPTRERLQELLSRVDYRKVMLREEAGTYFAAVPEGTQIDLGAVAKGYTGDVLIQILRQQGVRSAILDLGGNVQTLGGKPDGSPWKVAVRNPLDQNQVVGVLEINDKCVITSGGYERYFIGEDGEIYWHLLDPANGAPAKSGLLSVTVVGERGVRCDALSTALFVMGEEGAAEFWRRQGDFEMILVTEDGRLILTEGLRDCFKAEPDWADVCFYVNGNDSNG